MFLKDQISVLEWFIYILNCNNISFLKMTALVSITYIIYKLYPKDPKVLNCMLFKIQPVTCFGDFERIGWMHDSNTYS